MKFVQLRAVLAAVITIAGAVAATTGPAAADSTLGVVGTSSYSEAGHTVTGTGTWELWGDDSDQTLNIAFECASTGTPDAASASVHPPAYGGCYLVRNGITIASAPGVTRPGPAAATLGTATFSLYNTASLLVCWHTYASFQDGYLLQTSGCSSISVIDSIPDSPPTPPTVPPVAGFAQDCAAYTIRYQRPYCPPCPAGTTSCPPPAASEPAPE